MTTQGFAIGKDPSRKHRYRWLLFDTLGNAIADSGDDEHPTHARCAAAVELVRQSLPGAQVGAESGREKRADGATIAIEPRGAGWAWTLRVRRKETIGASLDAFATSGDAAAAVEAARILIAEAPLLDEPVTFFPQPRDFVPLEFALDRASAQWGDALALTLVSGTFGSPREVQLLRVVDPDAAVPQYERVAALAVPAGGWQADRITAVLPDTSASVADGLYFINLADPAGVAKPVAVTTLRFAVAPAPAEWGQTIALHRVSGDFGQRRDVQLLRQNAVVGTLAVPPDGWQSDAITAVLPAKGGLTDGVYDVNLAAPSGAPFQLAIAESPVFEFRAETKARWGAALDLVPTRGTFGDAAGTVLLGGAPLPVNRWTPERINVTIAGAPSLVDAAPHPLVVTKPSGVSATTQVSLDGITGVLESVLNGISAKVPTTTLTSPDFTVPVTVEGLGGVKLSVLGGAVEFSLGWFEGDAPLDALRAAKIAEADANVTYALAPRLVTPAQASGRTVTLRVTLRHPLSAVRKDLVAITVNDLPMPTAVGLFEHRDYKGDAIVVTLNGPEDRFEMRGMLEAASLGLNALAPHFPNGIEALPQLAGAALLLQVVVANVAPGEKTRFVRRSEIPNLSAFHFTQFLPKTAEDIGSSLFLVGLPGDQVHLFGARDYRWFEGMLKIALGPGDVIAAVPDLSRPTESQPPGRVETTRGGSFEDIFSSLTFTM